MANDTNATNEEILKSFQHAFAKCENAIEQNVIEFDSDDSNEVSHSDNDFCVEVYISAIQDNINTLLKSPDNSIYMGISSTLIKHTESQYIVIKITNISLDIGSNCRLLVTIGCDGLSGMIKRKMNGCEIDIFVLNKNTEKKMRLMRITKAKCSDGISARELIVYNIVRSDQYKKSVTFSLIDDLDIRENSIWFKIGYLDYTL